MRMHVCRTVLLTGDARLFSGLTFNRYHRLLISLEPSVIAVGAIAGGRPVGLALGICNGTQEAELLSIAVAPAERRRGIALALVQAWSEEAARRGAFSMIARYSETNAGRAAFEPLAARAGWSAPAEDGLLVTGRAGAMAEAVGAWRAISGRLAQPHLYDYATMNLSDADRTAVSTCLLRPEANGMLGPLALTDRMAPAFSTLIRREGTVVGWVVASQPAERSIHYDEAFLDPVYWHSGITIGAYHHCYTRQAMLLGRDSVATYYTDPTRPRMVALTRRRFAQVADRVETILAVRTAPAQSSSTSFNRKGSTHEHCSA
ncbi:GNAT family N-acetyltransferase (plasmid) [Shinella sp. H4-D48]|uniref:GNAT family N-acetyltransferase n=1 Tax=Shinella sp. H4-D48 TaxID=2925841 RepID=UPI001F538E2E|nr:GNAT family N-acetyltransferase [Shinella sp. H4-D48]UNK39980.1 GNAT family N-acetyltransferase [Shinella sp. H4-D48]